MLEMEDVALIRSHLPFWSPQQNPDFQQSQDAFCRSVVFWLGKCIPIKIPKTSHLSMSPLLEQDPEPRKDLCVDLELGLGVG